MSMRLSYINLRYLEFTALGLLRVLTDMVRHIDHINIPLNINIDSARRHVGNVMGQTEVSATFRKQNLAQFSQEMHPQQHSVMLYTCTVPLGWSVPPTWPSLANT